MNGELVLRPAGAGDHGAYERLFAELGVDDPVPGAERFAAELAPRTIVAERDGRVIGYVYFQELDGEGYVRQVAVAPEARRTGVGRTLLMEVSRRLRAAGARRWCLNVVPDNFAAIRLYEGLGLRPAYQMAAIRFPWTLVAALPPELDERGAGIRTAALAPAEDGVFEARFDIARGLLTGRRGQGYVLVALHEQGLPAGVAAFQPAHPGAFPFRVTRPGLAGPLLAALRPHARPDEPRMQVAIEDDPPLIEGLLAAGATLYLETVHYRGAL